MYWAKMKDGRNVLVMPVDRHRWPDSKGHGGIYVSASIEGGGFQVVRKDSLASND